MDFKKLAKLDDSISGIEIQEAFMRESIKFVAYLAVNGLLPFRHYFSAEPDVKGKLWELVIQEHICDEGHYHEKWQE